MKKIFFSLIIMTLVASSVVFAFGIKTYNSNRSNDSYDIHESHKLIPDFDEEVLACYEEVNAFRTGDEAWYWNSDNRTKTDLSGELGTLVLDRKLCEAAQIRANEIMRYFGHTRPNGESCFSVLRDCSIKYSACGENIAAGKKTGVATFTQWKEDNDKFDGQGHRRNMLGDYSKIGIAYAHNPDSDYGYYWTMILVR